jgi:putative transport protein
MIEGEEIYVQQSRQIIGKETPIDMFLDRHDLEQVEIYVSKPTVIGRKLGELQLMERLNGVVLSITRGNIELYPRPRLVLEAGDRVRVATDAENIESFQEFFGDLASSTAEVSYLALGLGMVLGVLFGLIPFPLPGLGTFTFGAAGGAMIVALVLGWLGRIGHLSWTMPPAANLTLRNFGLTLFLAVAGLRSAEKFLATVKETGFLLLGLGIVITLLAVLSSMILARTLFAVTFDEMLAVVAGVTGNPAILAYAAQAVPTNKPELGYAIVFPISTIIKIIVVQIILGILSNASTP